MAVTKGIIKVEDDAAGSSYLTYTHDTSSSEAVAGLTVIDTGSDFTPISSSNPMPVTGTITAVTDITNAVSVTNAGTFVVQEDGAALTALQLLDNVVYVDDADWTALTSSHSLVGGVYQSSPGSITDGDTGPLRLTVNGAAHVSVQGTVTVGAHAVTNAGTFAVQEDGPALTALQLIDDAVYVDDADWTDSTSKHILTGGVYQSSPQTITDGDTGPLQVTANGYAIVTVSGALPAGTNAIGKLAANAGVDIGSVGIKSAQTLATVTTVSTVSTLTGSSVAHDGVDAGNPHKIGARAITAWPTAVANADRTNVVADKFGRPLVTHVPRALRQRQVTTITSSTAETTIVTAGAAGVFNDIHSLQITNTSSTACNVTIKDSTAGTTVAVYAVPAGQTTGYTLPSCDGVKQTTAANNWTATCSASVASIVITALFSQMKDA